MINEKNPNQETRDRWHQDPNNWIWGIFYFNRKDKRIFPPKRTKMMGWTINFANPVSVFILCNLIATIVYLAYFVKQ